MYKDSESYDFSVSFSHVQVKVLTTFKRIKDNTNYDYYYLNNPKMKKIESLSEDSWKQL